MSWVENHLQRAVPSLVASCLIGGAVGAVLLWGWTPVISGVIILAAVLTIGEAATRGVRELLDRLKGGRDHDELPSAEADTPVLTSQASAALPAAEPTEEAHDGELDEHS
jgi:hypothetical protein